jgi:hypothetical protein
VIPALDSVLIMMLVGSVAALWAPLVWKAPRSWLSVWLGLLVEVVLEVLVGSVVEAGSA